MTLGEVLLGEGEQFAIYKFETTKYGVKQQDIKAAKNLLKIYKSKRKKCFELCLENNGEDESRTENSPFTKKLCFLAMTQVVMTTTSPPRMCWMCVVLKKPEGCVTTCLHSSPVFNLPLQWSITVSTALMPPHCIMLSVDV